MPEGGPVEEEGDLRLGLGVRHPGVLDGRQALQVEAQVVGHAAQQLQVPAPEHETLVRAADAQHAGDGPAHAAPAPEPGPLPGRAGAEVQGREGLPQLLPQILPHLAHAAAGDLPEVRAQAQVQVHEVGLGGDAPLLQLLHLLQTLVDGQGQLVGQLQGGPAREPGVEVEAVQLRLVRPAGAGGQADDQGEEEEGHGGHHGARREAQAGLEQQRVDLHRPLPLGDGLEGEASGPAPRQAPGDHGDQQQGHGQRHQKRRDDGDAHLPAQEADQVVLGEDEGQEDADRGQGRRHDGASHVGHAAGDGRVRFLPPGQPAVDALEDDDAVVDEHAHGDGHAHQRQGVQADAEGVEEVEGDQHRDRDRQGDHGHEDQVAQEDPEHGHGQPAADQGQGLDVADVVAHRLGGVAGHHQLHALRGQVPVQVRHHRGRRRRDLQQVGLGVAHQGQGDRLEAVHAGDRPALRRPVDDGRHLPQAQPLPEDGLLEVGHRGVVRDQADEAPAGAVGDLAEMTAGTGALGDAGPDPGRGEPVAAQHRLVEAHLDRAPPPSVHGDVGDAVHLAQRLDHLAVDHVADPVEAAVAPRLEGHEPPRQLAGVDPVHLHAGLRVEAGRRRGHPLLQPQVGVSGVDAAVVVDQDPGPPRLHVRLDALDAGQSRDRPFDGDDGPALDLPGLRLARALDLDHEHGQLGEGDQLHGQAGVGDGAQQAAGGQQHGHRHGPADDGPGHRGGACAGRSRSMRARRW